jgi:hypothetical protein
MEIASSDIHGGPLFWIFFVFSHVPSLAIPGAGVQYLGSWEFMTLAIVNSMKSSVGKSGKIIRKWMSTKPG